MNNALGTSVDIIGKDYSRFQDFINLKRVYIFFSFAKRFLLDVDFYYLNINFDSKEMDVINNEFIIKIKKLGVDIVVNGKFQVDDVKIIWLPFYCIIKECMRFEHLDHYKDYSSDLVILNEKIMLKVDKTKSILIVHTSENKLDLLIRKIDSGFLKKSDKAIQGFLHFQLIDIKKKFYNFYSFLYYICPKFVVKLIKRVI